MESILSMPIPCPRRFPRFPELLAHGSPQRSSPWPSASARFVFQIQHPPIRDPGEPGHHSTNTNTSPPSSPFPQHTPDAANLDRPRQYGVVPGFSAGMRPSQQQRTFSRADESQRRTSSSDHLSRTAMTHVLTGPAHSLRTSRSESTDQSTLWERMPPALLQTRLRGKAEVELEDRGGPSGKTTISHDGWYFL
ncbi:hypothetical protein P154DRAFT_17510 [Amniculicola lignicola CBS 123094]|uniref:Uncharacterized protein n=1 Tax=Amniculicola lignicola CBS 123094 TaxID=1392246 RepID=A0A6A5X5M8_9PLEO|nr:hypothetical protein P154DRAFT_17510 [Amniculicola lignicola CBS 123094]